MRNTGTLYRSTVKTPTVFPEFRDLLPPLSQEQQEALEKDILQNGCYAPLIVDQELRVVDGHNRLLICQNHEISYTMLVFEFEDALEAKQWALDTQKGRRNLDNWELGKVALKLNPDIEAKAQANHIANGGDKVSENARAAMTTLSKPLASINTRKELADSVGIGEVTMGKVLKIDEQAPDAVSSQNQMLARLNQQGLIDPDIFICQSNELTKQIRETKQKKERLLDQDGDCTLNQTQELLDVLASGPDILESFDAEIFQELVDSIFVESNASVRFRLKNGLELTETIERTVR